MRSLSALSARMARVALRYARLDPHSFLWLLHASRHHPLPAREPPSDLPKPAADRPRLDLARLEPAVAHQPYDAPAPASRTAAAGSRNRADAALDGAPDAPGVRAESGSRKSTRAPISGRIRGSRSTMVTLTCTVARCRSAVGTT